MKSKRYKKLPETKDLNSETVDKILNTICDYMDNYDSYIIKMQHQKQSLKKNFFHGNNLYKTINESILKT